MEFIDNKETIEKHLKKLSVSNKIISVIIALSTALGTGYAFFYNTKFTQIEQSNSILTLKTDVEEIKTKINNATFDSGVLSVEIINLKKDILRVETNQIRIEEKIDKIFILTKNFQYKQ